MAQKNLATAPGYPGNSALARLSLLSTRPIYCLHQITPIRYEQHFLLALPRVHQLPQEQGESVPLRMTSRLSCSCYNTPPLSRGAQKHDRPRSSEQRIRQGNLATKSAAGVPAGHHAAIIQQHAVCALQGPSNHRCLAKTCLPGKAAAAPRRPECGMKRSAKKVLQRRMSPS